MADRIIDHYERHARDWDADRNRYVDQWSRDTQECELLGRDSGVCSENEDTTLAIEYSHGFRDLEGRIRPGQSVRYGVVLSDGR